MKDVRVTFSRRHAYATKSNVLKVVKTPGGRLVGALNLANGNAGLLNILLSIIVRFVCNALVGGGAAEDPEAGSGADEGSGAAAAAVDAAAEKASSFSHTAFNLVALAMILAAVPTYLLWTRSVPAFRSRLLWARWISRGFSMAECSHVYHY